MTNVQFLVIKFLHFHSNHFYQMFSLSSTKYTFEKNYAVLKYVLVHKFDFTVNLPPALTSLMMASSGNLQYSSALTLYGLLGFKRSLILTMYKIPKYRFHRSFFYLIIVLDKINLTFYRIDFVVLLKCEQQVCLYILIMFFVFMKY